MNKSTIEVHDIFGRKLVVLNVDTGQLSNIEARKYTERMTEGLVSTLETLTSRENFEVIAIPTKGKDIFNEE